MVASDMRSLILGLAASSLLIAQPPSASTVMATAQAEATAQHKAIFLNFHASWCGWCKRLDAFMAVPRNKAVFDRYFVEARLDVQEHGAQESLQNPGGDELMEKLAGGKAGLPFFAFVDEKGAAIVNSIRPDADKSKAGNIGFPDKPWEIDWFMTMLHKAAPAMSSDEANLLESALKAHNP